MAFLQIILFFFLFFPFSQVHGLAIKDVPNPKTTANIFVQDSAKILESSSFSKINQICEELSQKTSIEMAMVTIDNLDGLTVEDYAEQRNGTHYPTLL